MRFCTIANGAQLPQARVLAQGLHEHHPGAELTLLRLGSGSKERPASHSRWSGRRTCCPSSPRAMRAAGSWADQTEYLKPHLIAWLLERDEQQGEEQLEEQRRARSSTSTSRWTFTPRFNRLRPRWERNRALLAPRLLGRLPDDGRRPGAADLRRAGTLGASLVAMRGREGLELARWWANRVARAASAPVASAAAQSPYARRELSRWIDLAPSVFPAWRCCPIPHRRSATGTCTSARSRATVS